jgi:hypothetical protein
MTAVEWLVFQICDTHTDTWKDVIQQAKKMEIEQSISFHNWMKNNDTSQKAEEFFHFTDVDMFNKYYL